MLGSNKPHVTQKLVDLQVGDRPGVPIWNANGRAIGGGLDSGNVESGSFYDYSISNEGDPQQGEYVSVSAQGEDGVCFSAVSLSSLSGQNYA